MKARQLLSSVGLIALLWALMAGTDLIGFQGVAQATDPDLPDADFNGDFYDDLAIGVRFEDVVGKTDAGAVHILYGSDGDGLTAAGDKMWVQYADPSGHDAEDYDHFGSSLAVGDFDGDRLMDLATGAPDEDVEREGEGTVEDAGAVSIMYGESGGLSTTRAEIWHQETGNVGSIAETDDQFGYALAAGDFDGDGRADLAVGVPYEKWVQDESGIVQILYGTGDGLSDARTQTWRQNYGGITEPEEADDHFGYAVASGDFNHDSFDDLAIGAPGEDFEEVPVNNVGLVHILYGSSDGLTSTGWQMWQQLAPETADRFGEVLATGDFDGDGYDDLAIGVPDEDTGSPDRRDAGSVDILYGSEDGLTPTGHESFDRGTGAEVEGHYGYALAAGDFDHDGRDDLAVGIPFEDIPAGVTDLEDPGAVEILYGGSGGLRRRTSPFNDFWHQDRSGMSGGFEALDHFGWSLAAADFDGDGYLDLAVGIPHECINDPHDYAGAAQIMYGSSDGITADRNWFVHQGLPDIDNTAELRDNFGWAMAAIHVFHGQEGNHWRFYLPVVIRNPEP